MNVEVEATLEDSKYINRVSDEFELENGDTIDLSDTTVGRVVLEGIDEDEISISGEISVKITIGDFNETYTREFVVSGEYPIIRTIPTDVQTQ